MMSIQKLAVANNATAKDLLTLLQSQTYAQEVAKNKFGFRAYDRLGKLRTLAITKPAVYLAAKRARIMGGVKSPQANDAATGNLSDEDIETLYGVKPNTDVTGVAGEVANIYASTLHELYTAGADESTAEKYATAVAQALLQSKMTVIEAEFPDPIDNASERNLLLNQLGTVGGRIALTTPKIKSIGHK